MKEIALLLHIFIALSSVLIALIGMTRNELLKKKTETLFVPSVFLTGLSGMTLLIFGGSFTRACMSGVVTISVLFTLRYVGVKMATHENRN